MRVLGDGEKKKNVSEAMRQKNKEMEDKSRKVGEEKVEKIVNENQKKECERKT